ncbi:MAG: tetratricopeptide repeat protein [Pirellulales bacterium]
MAKKTTRCARWALLLSITAAGCRTPGNSSTAGTGPLGSETWSNLSAKTSETAGKVFAPIAGGWSTAKSKLAGDPEAESKTVSTADVLSLKNTPKAPSPKLLVADGAIAEEKGDLERARQKYKQALQQDPGFLPAHLNLARTHRSQGELPAAIRQYQEALSFHPQDPSVNNDLGLALLESGQVDDAIARLQVAMQQDPQSTRYGNNLARALVRAGRDQEAVQRLAALIGPANAHYNVACLLQESKQSPLAADHLQQALAIDPQLAAAQEMLAQLNPIATSMASPSVHR